MAGGAYLYKANSLRFHAYFCTCLVLEVVAKATVQPVIRIYGSWWVVEVKNTNGKYGLEAGKRQFLPQTA